MNTLSTAKLNNRIRSFKLKRGYMVTFSNNPAGRGYSRCFIADQADLEFASLPKGDDPYTIGYDRAVELIEQHKAAAAAAAVPLKTFTEDADMLIKNGPYGAYIAYKGKNYRMPHGRKPEDMTYEECLEAVKNSKSTKGSRKK